MARPKKPVADARKRLLDAAGRGFRTGGFGGIGVDGLAREAGMTSGAFYAHFNSKADAFRLAVVDGMSFLREGVTKFQARHGPDWRDRFVDFYFGERMKVGIEQACALPTFTPDVARADPLTREAYDAELDRLIETFAAGFGDPPDRERACAFLALLSGGASIARAVNDERLRKKILAAAGAAAKAI
jgi:TetR/AcrR family transcriptional regulator, transcriptional repressor for nem operon